MTPKFSLSIPRWALLLLAACAPPSPNEASDAPLRDRVTYGAAMADVGRRFELLGRALAASRFELAEYELGELGEAFEDTLPRARAPREGHPEALPALNATFVQATFPDLRAAMATRELATATMAFARAAAACNACHQASGHAFIEISPQLLHLVPDTTPRSP